MSPTPLDKPSETAMIVARRRRRRLFRAVILLLILVGQEGLFRLLFPFPEVEGFNRVNYQQMASTHPNFGKAMDRGLVYDRILMESRPDGFTEVHNLNLYGFRGADFRIEPDPKRRRILVIGDSVTEGEGVDGARTIPADWSRLLANDGVSAEVINLGVIAASLPHLWILTRDAVSLLKPADVVLMLYANDLPAPNLPASVLDAPGPKFPRAAPELWRRPRLAVLIDRVVFEKPIYRRWPHFPARFFAPVPDGTNPWSDGKPRPDDLAPRLYDEMVAARLNPWLYHQSKDMPGMLAHDFAQGGLPLAFLSRMAEVCRRNGARLIVGYVPFCGVVHNRYAGPLIELGMAPATAEALSTDPKFRSQNRILATICAELNLPFVDATSALEKAEAAGRPQYWRYDTHPNPDGYATIAGRVHDLWRSLADAERPIVASGSPFSPTRGGE